MRAVQMVQDANGANRIPVSIPNQNMITHAIFAPVSTHWRKATCEEIGCLAQHNGWQLNTAGLPTDLVETAKRSGRHYTTTRDEDTGAEVLDFAAGQPCFKASEHRVRIDREEIFLTRRGDWRGVVDRHDKPRVFSGPDAFADSLHTQFEKFED